MPALLGDARIKEKFQDQEYLDTVEHMFREKFIENLSVSQKAFRPVHVLLFIQIFIFILFKFYPDFIHFYPDFIQI